MLSISEEGIKLPESVKYYNETKYRVEIINQMAQLYSTKVSTHCWPLQNFYNVIDLAGINAYIIYKEVIGKILSRHGFLLKLIQELQMNGTFKETENVNDSVLPSPKTK